MTPKFKVGDLIKIIPGRSEYKDIYDPMLLISFHPEEKKTHLDGSTLKLYSRWTVLVLDHLEQRYEDYLNRVGEKLNDAKI